MASSGTTASSHAARVAAHYDENTEPFYLRRWHPEDVHFGYFPDRGAAERDHHAAVKRMTGRVLAPAGIAAGMSCVDAGCGVGGPALDIARDSGAHVLGLSISSVQLDIARERAQSAGLSHLAHFEHADCTKHLPCDDSSVDVVLTMEAACHFDDKPAFLRECRRVLRPGGRLVGSDWMAADAMTVADYDEYLRPVCDAWRLADLPTAADWERSLRNAGFEVRECVDLAEAVLPNARILARGRLDLMLEAANGSHPAARVRLWQEQYDTLMRAWFERRFTIGCFHAVAP
jgi:cyclopropane fatty-acyl-phospholipid synthase-like methyltransferase